jgi:hypothetical protein
MATREPEYVVAWPTLWIVPDWIEAHCVIPDGFRKGDPLEMYDWQLWSTVNHYRIRPDAARGLLATAFWHRRSQIVAPQKTGKGPWSATIVANEAVGPAVFDGWAGGGEIYRCADHGCSCGWEYEYEPGEPMAVPWPTPRIQLLATSVDQVDNVYAPLKAMIKGGPLADQMRVGEEFIRLPGDDGRIDVVTSSALARLGNPITFALQDETGLYTKQNKMRRVAETQRRGLAGMGGRSMETTNCWDPSEDSVAQSTFQSERPDIFKFYRPPPAHLSYGDRRERHQIHRYVYRGSVHVDLAAIEAEAAELMERDRAQAERFFGNKIVPGTGSYLDQAKWDLRAAPRDVPDGTVIVLGMDGSDVDDWTGIRAETREGYQFTPVYGPDRLACIWDPAQFGGQVPRLEVDAAMEEIVSRYVVARAYCDPPFWETPIDQWAERYGDRRFLRWYTRSVSRMHPAAQRLATDVTKAGSTFAHDGCRITAQHIGNARKSARGGGDPKNPPYVLVKPSDAQKIDMAMSSILCHEAAGDALAAGEMREQQPARMTIYRR